MGKQNRDFASGDKKITKRTRVRTKPLKKDVEQKKLMLEEVLLFGKSKFELYKCIVEEREKLEQFKRNSAFAAILILSSILFLKLFRARLFLALLFGAG